MNADKTSWPGILFLILATAIGVEILRPKFVFIEPTEVNRFVIAMSVVVNYFIHLWHRPSSNLRAFMSSFGLEIPLPFILEAIEKVLTTIIVEGRELIEFIFRGGGPL